jgi:hypothetical protein
MIPVLDTKRLAANHLYPTLFGFSTKNKVPAQLLNYVYGVVMVVAMAFAYHALGLILSDWNKLFVFLASLSVVGLPYCIKIVLFGNEKFEAKHAYLCLAISILPAIFDFVGFYSETSIKQTLTQTKFQIVEKISYFNTEAREKLETEKIDIIKKRDNEISKLKADTAQRTSSLENALTDAKQVYIDETEGVRSQSTSGKPGSGPRAKEYQAEIRKTQAKNDLEVRKINQEQQIEEERIKNQYQQTIDQCDAGLKEIDTLVSSDAKAKGLLFQVNNAQNFSELSKIVIIVNNSISTISSKMSLEPKFVSYTTDDVIQLSFSALLRGEITALICCLLAFLLEMVDIIIVYMIRGTKKQDDDEDNKKDKEKEKIFFKKYDTNIMPEKNQEMIDSFFYPYKNYTKN